ncbi:hypothetical protein [Flavobacterium sp. AJR]|jgi:hypothetical protein|uniref:hypothetical protein n=1 Tax=Flavobacterium sp. AJR TaxID=1979369 RepID=UPI000A3D7609|nr:hypothetical protein [Flavobacterium sp. AJR]OUL63718.1 hypothetical protein B8T70_03760 [Flavobacterium sp. AJR]
MTTSQTNIKIQELETWLIQNPNNAQRSLIESDLKNLRNDLEYKNQINSRIALLYLSLQFCSEQMKIFTIGERICVNQERFQWMHILSEPDAEPRPVSATIETKINDITRLVAIYKFKPFNDDPFDYKIENE